MSRIHDALRRAEEALRKNGNGSGQGPADPDQALEILEVLRVAEEVPDLGTDSQGIGSMPYDFGASGSEANWDPRATVSEPPQPIPANEANISLIDTVLSAARGARDGGEVVELPRAAQPIRREISQEPAIPIAAPLRSPVPAPRAEVTVPLAPDAPLSFEELATACGQREWKPNPQQVLSFDLRSPNPIGLEEFRTLRSRLYQIRQRQKLSRLLITSALPAEGKTFVSLNLAQTLARQRGRRVLLVDCDLRRSQLHFRLGTDGTPGLSDYLRGDADEFAIMQRGSMENLAFIPGGRQTSNPAELISNGRLELLLKRLANAFDWVVIDSPPAVPVSDASVLARYCDGILLVVKSAQTPFDLAQRARNEFRNMPLLGVVLNAVEVGSTYVSYYYGAYGDGNQDAAATKTPGSTFATGEGKS